MATEKEIQRYAAAEQWLIDLRDSFALSAMNGLLSFYADEESFDYKDIAATAYTLADAMLAAREARDGDS